MAKYAKNIKVLNADGVEPLNLLARFDYKGVGYIASCLDNLGSANVATISLEKEKPELIFAETWTLRTGRRKHGVVSEELYEAMDEALNVAYEVSGI